MLFSRSTWRNLMIKCNRVLKPTCVSILNRVTFRNYLRILRWTSGSALAKFPGEVPDKIKIRLFGETSKNSLWSYTKKKEAVVGTNLVHHHNLNTQKSRLFLRANKHIRNEHILSMGAPITLCKSQHCPNARFRRFDAEILTLTATWSSASYSGCPEWRLSFVFHRVFQA